MVFAKEEVLNVEYWLSFIGLQRLQAYGGRGVKHRGEYISVFHP
jgi:hypothetical protein